MKKQTKYKGKIEVRLKDGTNQFVWKITYRSKKNFSKLKKEDFFVEDCYGNIHDCLVEKDVSTNILRVIPREPYEFNSFYYLNMGVPSLKSINYVVFIVQRGNIDYINLKNRDEYTYFRKKI